MIIAKKFLVSGRVQGVGFRWFVEDWANRLRLRGYVRNLHDGRVEAYAVGDPDALEIFKGRLQEGAAERAGYRRRGERGTREYRLQGFPYGRELVARCRPENQRGGYSVEQLRKLIREVPDFPKPGILFYDITTLLKDPEGLRLSVDQLAEHYVGQKVDRVVGIEARGFIFAPLVAYRLKTGFVPARKPNKLPAPAARETYSLEYGEDALEIHKDAISNGERVLIIDDLLATGGTAAAVVRLVKSLGGEVVGLGFAIELDFLKGREKLPGHDVFSLLHYSE